MWKILPALIDGRIRQYLEDIGPFQQGFRQAGSIPALIATLEGIHRIAALKDSPVYVLFLDFANAFGSLPLQAVTMVLQAYRISDPIVGIVANRISNATAKQWSCHKETHRVPPYSF